MNWEQAWLRYDRIEKYPDEKYFESVTYGSGDVILDSAAEELKRAAKALFGKELCKGGEKGISFKLAADEKLGREGYHLHEAGDVLTVAANAPAGILYGVFALIRKALCREKLSGIDEISIPDKEMRMLNHWDNTDGSIERGYSGQSFFFEKGGIKVNERTQDYARLVASVGINAVVINNVNVKNEAVDFITEEYLPKLAELAEVFGRYAIKLYLSLDYAACMEIGGLDTADPLAPEVISWWEERMALVYRYLPGLGGFLVKADSEGRPGPFTYGRNQAQGANMLAKAIKPHGGKIIWRCFVYNCLQDWRDRSVERARAAYDYFYPLDGEFDEDVILQIKNGPIDFQVREPIMPLFGKLRKTNHIMEVQIAQEYTGHQIDVCYLIPWFSEILNTHTCCADENDTMADLLSGRCCDGAGHGITAVTNTGNDPNWTGHDLAAANLYGFGRLAWNSGIRPEEIAVEWIKQTFSNDEEVIATIEEILMMSWPAYEKYTAPMGVGMMVKPGFHYGPDVDGYEYSRWGVYHRADHMGVGPDRSCTGTDCANLYNHPLAELYDNLNTCPDNLLLFFHHVPYTHILQNGKTVIQHIYDTHFEGVVEVEKMVKLWEKLEGKIDAERFERTMKRFESQKLNAVEWRDQINNYFHKISWIPDEAGRKIY